MTAEHQGNEIVITDTTGDSIVAGPSPSSHNVWVIVREPHTSGYALLTPDDTLTLAEHLIKLARQAHGKAGAE